ncbi:MAG: ParA family protein [Elusimicrobia bacterium]|nr:ParA family protein [Elusimicrobiota bacterium]
MPEIITVINQKGGSGKTTTCVNLGACLAELGRKVLVIDLDPQRNATLHLLGKEKALKLWQESVTAYDVLAKGCPIAETVVETGVEGLGLVPSHINLAGADLELNVIGREKILREKLRTAVDQYDYILMDCSSSIGVLTLNAFCAAKSVIITLQAEYLALEGMGQLLNTLKLVQDRLDWPVRLMGALITFFDQRKIICRQVAQSAEEFFEGQTFKTRIRDNVRLAEAPSHGKPITLYDPDCYGAEDYRNLAREVAQYVECKARREPAGVN